MSIGPTLKQIKNVSMDAKCIKFLYIINTTVDPLIPSFVLQSSMDKSLAFGSAQKQSIIVT